MYIYIYIFAHFYSFTVYSFKELFRYSICVFVLYVYLYHFIGAFFLVFHCLQLFVLHSHLLNCIKL